MERKLNIKVLLPEEVIEKYDIDEDTGVLSYFEDCKSADAFSCDTQHPPIFLQNLCFPMYRSTGNVPYIHPYRYENLL